jgi:hypothetical protein
MSAGLISTPELSMQHEHRQDQAELADAILEGAKRRPSQSFGSYFGDDGSSCALGAAYDGVYHLPAVDHSTRPRRLDWLFDCLDNITRRCPVGCKKRLPLGSMIVHLNDDHTWTREQIAEWLRKT